MIAPLRRRHLRTFAALTLILPALYLAALGARPEWPTEEGEPIGEASAGPRLELDEGVAVSVGNGHVLVEPLGGPVPPDLLLYWAPQKSGRTDGLPPDARLIGPVGGERARLPLEESASGVLLLYSLAHGELGSVLTLPLLLPPDAEGAR